MLAPGYSCAAPHSCIVNSPLADECHTGACASQLLHAVSAPAWKIRLHSLRSFFHPLLGWAPFSKLSDWYLRWLSHDRLATGSMLSLVGKWLAALLLQFCDGWSRVALKGHVCFGGFAEVFWKLRDMLERGKRNFFFFPTCMHLQSKSKRRTIHCSFAVLKILVNLFLR